MRGKPVGLASAIITILLDCAMVASAQSLTPADILETNKLSLVRISISGTQFDGRSAFPVRVGTGFFISERGHILTALHVVGENERFERDSFNRVVGRRVKVEEIVSNFGPHVVTEDTRNVILSPYADLAMVKVGEKVDGQYDPIDHLQTCQPSGDSDILAVVWRGRGRPETVRGEVKQADETSSGGLVRFAVVSGDVQKGDSGAPVFDVEGRLVGVLSGEDIDEDKYAYFVPVAAAASLLFNIAVVKPCAEASAVNTDFGEFHVEMLGLKERIERMEKANIALTGRPSESSIVFKCLDLKIKMVSSQLQQLLYHNQRRGLEDGSIQEDVGFGITSSMLKYRMKQEQMAVADALEASKECED